jgi:hypothetical protein
MSLQKTLVLTIVLFIYTFSAKAQIFSPSASDSVIASYGTDKVFVFNAPSYQAPVNASLIAVATDTNNDWTFQWSVYSPSDTSFTTLPGTVTGHTSSMDNISVNSGYRVTMSRNAETMVFTSWVVINDLDLKITNKDSHDTILYGYYDCTSLDLHADTTKPGAFYYNPLNGQKLIPGSLLTIRWTTDNPEATNPGGRLLTRVSNPPWKDTRYIVTVTDRFGLIRKDSAVYNSIQSKADLTEPEYLPPSEDSIIHPKHEWYDKFYSYEDGAKSAPALFKLDVSGSKNFENYILAFGDGDSIVLGNDSTVIYHEYKKPGQYKALLTTKSGPPFECIDSVSAIVVIDEATGTNFIMPNVFTPDGSANKMLKYNENAVNSVFRTTDVSIIYIDIAIYSRTGLKVHEFEGNIRDWGGWDGKIMNSNRDAPEGVYFYVISRFIGYTDHNDPISKKLMKGFIHLYRKN